MATTTIRAGAPTRLRLFFERVEGMKADLKEKRRAEAERAARRRRFFLFR